MMQQIKNAVKYFPSSKRKTFRYDPAAPVSEKKLRAAGDAAFTVFRYNAHDISEEKFTGAIPPEDTQIANDHVYWINADNLSKSAIEKLCSAFKVHPLLIEDILSEGQRAKMDEVEGRLFCLLPMIYFRKEQTCIESEQVSIVVGENFVLSFQEDALRDVFDPLRQRLKSVSQRLRERGSDYLCYALLDVIVDSYFAVLEKLAERIDEAEDRLLANQEKTILADIAHLRKEVMSMKRLISPVRDLVTGFLRTNNSLIEARNEKYFKDVLDHIIQANEHCDGLRDMLGNLQDLYMNQINLRTNEVMKIFTMVSLLLAPATVIGGIFGMNFDRIPLRDDKAGFYISVIAMLLIPLLMVIYFRRKKWL